MGKLFKSFILLTGISLLLAGCAKEEAGLNGLAGDVQTVTFTASMDNSAVTKAVADNDGHAASVNRCIMEIYYGDELFTRMYSKVNASTKKASFQTQLVSNRTYTVAFWADHVDMAGSEPTDNELTIDKFYVTGNGLKAVTLNGTTYVGNNDMRDAFFHCGSYTVEQDGSAWTDIKLYRPFAQMNVITTDVATVAKIDGLKPDNVNLTIKNAATEFNVVDGSIGTTSNLTYTAPIYKWDSAKSECTLSMDYLFAASEKAVIDIDWKAQKGTNDDVSHDFTNIPYQRNYRTNIKGALLTTTGQWNVEVVPTWNTPEENVAFTVVNDIASANDFVANNTDKKEINVTFSSQPNDAGDPTTSGKNAIVTSLLAENAVYNIDVASTNEVLYVGDYDYETSTGGTTTYIYTTILPASDTKTKAASVNLVVTNSEYIGTLIVNSPSKSVSINGQTIASGKAYHIENLTIEEVSMSTVIIESGMTVSSLTMKKGGLEIHGTVGSVTIPENTTAGTIVVRDCENLSEDIYNKLSSYIASGYVSLKGRTTADKWDIYPAPCKIGETVYATLQAALDAVNEGETILLTTDITQEAGVHFTKAYTATLDLNGHTFKVTNDTENSHRAIKITKGTLNIENGSIDARNVDANGQPQAVVTYTTDGMYGSVRVEDSGAVKMSGVTVYNNHCYGASVKVCEGSAQTSVFDSCTFYSEYSSSFEIASSSTVKNSTINQQGVSESDSWKFNCAGIAASQGATATVKDVICNASNPIAVWTTGGTVNIDGGTYTTNVDNGDVVRCYGTYNDSEPTSDVNIQNGTFSGKLTKTNNTTKANISLTGGKYSVNPSDFVASGYGAVQTGDATYPYEVKAATVARISSTGYTTLEAAISAVNDDETVVLLTDYTLSDYLVINNEKTFTLNLGGKTLTGRVKVSGSNLTVKNGTIDGGTTQMIAIDALGTSNPAYANGIFTYIKVENDVTLKGPYGLYFHPTLTESYFPYSYGVKVDFYGKITSNSPVFVSGNIGNDQQDYGDVSQYAPSGINSRSKAMYLYGPELNLYGELTSIESNPDEHPQGMSVNGMARINVYTGATITGGEAIGMKSGNVTIYGGTLVSNGPKVDPVQAVSSGTEASGAAISVTSYYTNDYYGDRAKMSVKVIDGDIQSQNNSALLVTHSYSGGQPVPLKQGVDLNITGGKFTCGADVPVIFIDNAADGDAFAMPSAFITGGSYSKAPTESYIGYGKMAKLNGTYYDIVDSDQWIHYAASSYITPITTDPSTQVKIVTISNAEELALFAKNPINGVNESGKHTIVNLNADIDLTAHYWVPIKMSCVDFNGNSHTISNLTVVVSENTGAGLFGVASISTVTNLTIDKANITGTHYVAAIAGHGLCGHFTNCTVKKATLTNSVKDNDNGDKTGAICGYLSGESTAEVTNCTAENCTITGYRDLGGLVGMANETASVTGNTVKDCTINNDQRVNPEHYTEDSQYNADEVVGRKSAGATINNNTATNVTINRITE